MTDLAPTIAALQRARNVFSYESEVDFKNTSRNLRDQYKADAALLEALAKALEEAEPLYRDKVFPQYVYSGVEDIDNYLDHYDPVLVIPWSAP